MFVYGVLYIYNAMYNFRMGRRKHIVNETKKQK